MQVWRKAGRADHRDFVPLERTVYEQVVMALRLHGWAVYRLSQARASKQSAGVPDAIAMRPGRLLFVEVKRPMRASTQSPAQREFEGHVLHAGMPEYVIIRDPREVEAL